MIDVTVANTDLNIARLYTHMNPLVAGAEVSFHSKTRIVFTEGLHRFVVTGTALQWIDGALQGGAVDALTFANRGKGVINFANLQTTAGTLWSAMQAEQDGSNPTALTQLLAQPGWTYQGSAGVDLFPQTTLAPYGLLDLIGADRISLNGGDDVFFAGSGDDTVFGGDGTDRVAGGAGNDALAGGSGLDRLDGGTEDDRLDGNRGRDRLWGGDGADFLTGGQSADTMAGGAGADVFVFDGVSGQDVIVDYTPGLDRLQINSDNTVTLEGRGEDSMIHFGHNSILLVGVTAGEFSGGGLV